MNWIWMIIILRPQFYAPKHSKFLGFRLLCEFSHFTFNIGINYLKMPYLV